MLDGNSHYSLKMLLKILSWNIVMIIAEQLFLEHLFANTEGCNYFDLPHCYFNVSDVEVTFNFLFFNKEELRKTRLKQKILRTSTEKTFRKKIDRINWCHKLIPVFVIYEVASRGVIYVSIFLSPFFEWVIAF